MRIGSTGWLAYELMKSRTPATDAAFTDPTVTQAQQRGLCEEFEIENKLLTTAGWRLAKALECARGHGYQGGGPALAEWSALANAANEPRR